MASVVTTTRSNNPIIDGLLTDYRWSTFQLLRYGFPLNGFWSGYPQGSEPYVDYDPLTPSMQGVVSSIFSSVESLTTLTFWNANLMGESPDEATFRFGRTGDTDAAHAYIPYIDETAGDVWFANDGTYDSPVRGDYAYMTMLHEIGHALGLKHPHENEFFGVMPLNYDNMNYTVMSYRSYFDMDVDAPFPNADYGFPQTYMMYDIAALQHLYGADFTFNNGNTLYQWNPTTGYMSVDGTVRIAPGANIIFMTLWDGGGIDTYDLSAYSSTLSINLAPGEWIRTNAGQLADLGDGHFAMGNIANALLYQGNLGSLIENAIGGSGNDVMFGNLVANTLNGGAGNDFIDGLGGGDTMIGGAGDDRFFADHPGDSVVELEGGGYDKVEVTGSSFVLGDHVEEMIGAGSGPQQLTGSATANYITVNNSNGNVVSGGGGNDSIGGRFGWDVIRGDAGDDSIGGGGGDDILDGGTGNDSIDGEDGNDIINGGADSDVLRGQNGDDQITGGTGDDDLRGGNGTDVIEGGEGNDRIRGGVGSDRVDGGAGDDNISGDNGPEDVDEDDAAGLDTLIGGSGADLFETGLGEDRILYLAVTDSTEVSLDSIRNFTPGPDKIDLSALPPGTLSWTTHNEPSGGALYSLVRFATSSGTLAIKVYGTVAATDFILPAGTPQIVGTEGDDVLTGTGGPDDMLGLGGNDSLSGLGDNDKLNGGSGNDLLDGGAGADEMTGGTGNDVYVVDQSGDTVIEGADAGTDEIRTDLFNYSLAGLPNIENLRGTSSLRQILRGNGLDNRIDGGSHNDELIGAAGADVMAGHLGDDFYVVENSGDSVVEDPNEGTDTVQTALASYALTANVENLQGIATTGQTLTGNGLGNLITAGAGNDLLSGGGGNDTLEAGGGNDILDGGAGADSMMGGAGDDIFLVDDAADSIGENQNGGFDEVRSTAASYALANPFTETLRGMLDTGQVLIGGSTIIAGAGNDTLDGAATMIGGRGNDTYYVRFLASVVEAADEGVDTVHAVGSTYGTYQIPDNVENLVGHADGTQEIIGNALDNDIVGGNGANAIDGGLGADSMHGLGGDDRYTVDNVGDVVDEGVGQGFRDTIYTALAIYVLPANVEDLISTATSDQILTGNALANFIVGGTGNDLVRSTAGNDNLYGGEGEDTLSYAAHGERLAIQIDGSNNGTVTQAGGHKDNFGQFETVEGTAFNDHMNHQGDKPITFRGLGGNDTIGGGDGSDTLDGGAGADLMFGGRGNDLFLVDDPGDQVFEDPNEGTDEIRTALAVFSIASFANVENLTGTSNGGQTLIGNGSSNFIVGGSGDDLIEGGGAPDVLRGALGNDIYVVEDAGDNLDEIADGGTDEVRTALASFSLASLVNFENLTGTSSSGQTLTGNGLANFILGGSGNDIVDGGAGADILRGALGNDVYVVDDEGDNIDEVADGGTDEIRTSLAAFSLFNRPNFENLTGTSNSGQILEGNALANIIRGGAGNDSLYGAGGADSLIGGLGNDIYFAEDAGDTITELAAEGTDEVRIALATFSLAGFANVENLTGLGAIDHTLSGNASDNVIDGGLGADSMTGGIGNDVYMVDNAGDLVSELAGEGTDEVRTSLATYSLLGLANVENLTATSNVNHDFRGNGGDNVITGAAGNDTFRMQDGGTDSAIGGNGNDFFLFGASLTSADSVDGGLGTDQVAIQGNYTLTLGAGFRNIESLIPLPGNDIRFGDSGSNFYDYDLTALDSNLSAGQRLYVDGNRLRAGEDFSFDGSAETDGNFFLVGGHGVDTFTGGLQNDTFLFGENGQLGAGDTVNGGPGGNNDQFALRGNYTVTFGAGQMVGIEAIVLVSAQDTRFGPLGSVYNYNLTMHDSNAVGGVLFTIDGGNLRGGETLTVDASAETDASYRIAGGAGADTITGGQQFDLIIGRIGADTLRGGAGNDVFRIDSTAESNASGRDSILDFTSGDRIDLSRMDANSGVAGDQAFTFIGSAAFGNQAGALRFEGTGGNSWLIQGDTDGNSIADFEVAVTIDDLHAITAADFIL